MMSLKKLLRTMVIFFALFIVCAGSASAAVVGVGTINVEALRLRQEPNTESTILDTVYLGSEVIILEKANDTWYKVSYGATEGYMAAEYLDVSSSKDADLGYGQVQNVDSVLNVRSGPGTAYDKVTSLRASAIVKIIGIKDGWYYIQNNDVKGYVSGDYMVPCAEGTPTAKASFDGELSEQIVSYAKQFLGVPYVYGANGPDSFDCSGFTKYVYAHFGYSLNRTASSQMDNGREVSLSEI